MIRMSVDAVDDDFEPGPDNLMVFEYDEDKGKPTKVIANGPFANEPYSAATMLMAVTALVDCSKSFLGLMVQSGILKAKAEPFAKYVKASDDDDD